MALAWVTATGQVAASPDVPPVKSPGGDLQATFRLDERGRATYEFSFRGRVVANAYAGLRLSSGTFGDGLRVVTAQKESRDRHYSIAVGKASKARDLHHEVTVTLEDAKRDARFDLELRVFDDAFAFRYSVPKQRSIESFHLLDEQTEFSFVGDPVVHVVPLPNYTSSYEAHYKTARLSALPIGSQLFALPVLMHPSETPATWLAVTEAGLNGYAGAYLVRSAESRLAVRLSPLPGRSDGSKVLATLPHVSPWRVLFVGDTPGRFLESNVVFHLNEPSKITDASWIRPGRTTFPWWNGYALEGVDFEPGLNTATHKHYIDFCAEHGIELHSLDGTSIAWYGGPIVPDGPTDVTTAVEGLDVEELFRYAKQKGVRLRVWSHWKALRPQIDQALPLYAGWGAEGIMVDFMDRDDQEMVAFYHEVAKKAAENRLTVSFHGSYKPTGMERTWPNVLTYESALNQEYNKWDDRGTPPSHNLDVAFVRMIAGPVDYHQGGMRHTLPEQYSPTYQAPYVQGTRAHQLAMFVVYQNHLPMLADFPAAYREQPGLDFLSSVPTSWDETRVLDAVIGKRIVVARRRGTSWYVGGMAGDKEQEVRVPLAFMSPGKYDARWYEDPPENSSPAEVVARQAKFETTDSFRVRMGAGGGFAGVWSLAN